MNIIKLLHQQYSRAIKMIVSSWSFREAMLQHYGDYLQKSINVFCSQPQVAPVPDEYGLLHKEAKSSFQHTPVFITARFRSGSTFLWNIFRNTSGITAYYEPLHAETWRFVAVKTKAAANTRLGHIGVKNYGDEYIGKEAAGALFDSSWSYRNLYLTPMHHEPGLRAYIQALIDLADGRAVLQFNRVDFRLSWLKANFPEVPIIHLFRHPREQWASMILTGGAPPPLDAQQPFSRYELFYTLEFCQDLKVIFPFLDHAKAKHPYDLAYLLWRLSYSHGVMHADFSIAYERLQAEFSTIVQHMMKQLGIVCDLPSIVHLNRGREKMRWPEYAPSAWYEEREAYCDEILERYFDVTTGGTRMSVKYVL